MEYADHAPNAPRTEPDGQLTPLSRITERLERTASLLDSILDRSATPDAAAAAEILAREADHRIKNNLQGVVSMLHQQAAKAEAPAAREVLQLAGARVAAIAQVHATLHATLHPGRHDGAAHHADLGYHLQAIAAALATALGVDGERRTLTIDVETAHVSPDLAQRLGMLVTELITNALRHAFEDDCAGTVTVTGRRDRNGAYRLCVADDGKGLPAIFDMRLRPTGLGLRLVNVIADQVRGRLTVDGKHGARFTLVFRPET